MHEGGCLCGAVRFSASGPLRGVVYCHCSMCRRQSGHFFAATRVADARLRIEGTEKLTWYSGSRDGRRGFCSLCGSALFWKLEGLDQTSVMAGSFDKPAGLLGMSHIFVADKGDYYEITDGLPQFERGSPSVKTAED